MAKRLRSAWCLAWLAWVMASSQAEEAGKSTTDFPVGAGNWRNFGWKVGTTHADVLKLGSKFRLSGIGDGKANDDWLRLFNHGNTGFSGGFAAGKLWGKTTFVTHLHLGNKWRLSADGDGSKGKNWLRLSAARGNSLFGGFSAGKLHTKKLSVEGPIETDSLTVAKQFMLASNSKVDDWVRLLDPLTKDHPKKGGLALGNLRAIKIAASSKVTTKYLQLGKKWRLSGGGDGVSNKSDEWLRLTSIKGDKMFGGFEALKMRTTALQVHKKATFSGEATFHGATFKGKVHFKQHAQFESIGGKSAQVGNIMLSNKKERKHPARDCLHLYRMDGRTHTGLEVKSLWSQDASTSILTLGTKWRLSAIGDKYHNDDWVRPPAVTM